ncbi:MAG: hypothetical protein RQ760_02920 [Sedimentisphaerales bacterium]|nr:hypothetical protein [Sedimentisphaerales bacterium]
MENASFITNEDGDDLIVSFAIPLEEEGNVKSLTLLRTPKYEFALDESERGVKIFSDDFSDEENELLEKIAIEGEVVSINTNFRTYTVSIKDVDDMEVEESKRIIKKMNFDERFEIRMR